MDSVYLHIVLKYHPECYILTALFLHKHIFVMYDFKLCDDHIARCIDGCGPGYYLQSSNLCTPCQFCINDSCDPITGVCDIGCGAGYYIGSDGFCDALSKTCKDRACDSLTGAC